MNTDYRIRIGFFRHYKTRKLEKRLGPEGVIALLKLWEYSAEFRPEGNLSGMADEDIELSVGWDDERPLMPELAAVGFVDGSNGEYRLHDWQEHNPWAAEADERSDEARLSRLFRTNAEKAKELKAEGRTGITPEEYQEYKNPAPKYARSTHVVRSNNERSSERSTPAPAPAPAPAPFSFPPTPLSTEPDAAPPKTKIPKKEKKGEGSADDGETAITPDWVPAPGTVEVCESLGITQEFAIQQIPAFRLWHTEEGTRKRSFERLFAGWVKNAWLERAPPTATVPAYTARPKHMTLLEWDEYQRRQLHAASPPEPDPFASVFQRQPTVPALPILEGSYERTH